jgi:hypothetical protein
MSLYQLAESLLVPLIVIACAISVAARYMPRTRERIKAALANMLGGSAATGWKGRVVARLAPKGAAGCASGCDSGGCNTCGSNESPGEHKPTEQTVKWVRKP